MLVTPVKAVLDRARLREPIGRLRRGIREPGMLWVHLVAPPRASVEEAVLRLCPSSDPAQVAGARQELRQDAELTAAFHAEAADELSRQAAGSASRERLHRLAAVFAEGRLTRSAQGSDILECIYACVRLQRPQVIVETGTFDGRVAAVIARALQRNGGGRLISVDLPAYQPIPKAIHVSLPPGRDSGWLIPPLVRPWCEVRLGDSRELLPRVFAEQPRVDLFLHDSLHTDAHMRFEYETAWPRLAPGGVLLSDDIFMTPAFHRFCRSVGQRYTHLGSFGGVRKPG